ncbi:MAG: zinc ABC transporter substrate-binding protein [Rubrobacteridae bacterium]|nr:zinc ABC transporter substrate-binding protein [Rubrobacteridae bacterium]
MSKRFIIAVFVVVLAVVIASVVFSSRQKKPDGKIEVVASSYPFAEVAQQVGGDRINLSTVVPSGVEPHDF